jgi:hypothetical protein
MQPATIAVLVGFVAAVITAVIFVRGTRSYGAQIVLALLLVPPALFCVYGFATTFEPMDGVKQWTFRISYVAVGLGLAVAILFLLFRRPSPSAYDSRRYRFLSSGGFALLSVCCAFVFLGAGELEGQDELNWRIGSGALGTLALIAALYMACRKK